MTHRPSWMDVSVARGEYAFKVQIIEEVIRDYGGLTFGSIREIDWSRNLISGLILLCLGS